MANKLSEWQEWLRIVIIVDTQKIKRIIEGGSLQLFVNLTPVPIWTQRQHHISVYLSSIPRLTSAGVHCHWRWSVIRLFVGVSITANWQTTSLRLNKKTVNYIIPSKWSFTDQLLVISQRLFFFYWDVSLYTDWARKEFANPQSPVLFLFILSSTRTYLCTYLSIYFSFGFSWFMIKLWNTPKSFEAIDRGYRATHIYVATLWGPTRSPRTLPTTP